MSVYRVDTVALSSHFLELTSLWSSRMLQPGDTRLSIYLNPIANQLSLSPQARIFHGSKKDMLAYDYLISNKNKKKKPMKVNCTGSRYIGEWGDFGFEGKGLYRYPHGVIYDGFFNKHGEFNGYGCLIYPNGQKLQGVWKNGKLQPDQAFIYASGECADENFPYCKPPDRRFHVEVQNYFGQVGQEYLTSDQPTKILPPGCYDLVYGIFNPQTCVITKPSKKTIQPQNTPFDPDLTDEKIEELNQLKKKVSKDEWSYVFDEIVPDDNALDDNDFEEIIEIPTQQKIDWIKENCRKAWDEPCGYVPSFFNPWMTGTMRDQRKQSVMTIFDMRDDGKDLQEIKLERNVAEPNREMKLFSFIQRRQDVGSTKFRRSLFSRKIEEEKKTKRPTIHWDK